MTTTAELETQLANERDRREEAELNLEDAHEDMQRSEDEAATASSRAAAVEQILVEVRDNLRRAVDALEAL